MHHKESPAERRIIELLAEQIHLMRAEEHLLREIIHILTPRTGKIVITFGGIMPATPGTEAIGQTISATIVPLEADGITVTPGAVVSNPQWSVDNPAIASFVANPDGSATFTGVSAGTANVSVTATVTDQSGTANPFTATNVLTVTQPTGVTSSIQINFGSPVGVAKKA